MLLIRFLSFVFLFILYMPVIAFSQALTDSVYRLKELDVVANLNSKTLTSSSPYHSLDNNTLVKSGVTDIADALHRLPGINLRDYGGAGGLKTVAIRGFGAAHTAVLYDGVSLSNVQNGTIDISRYSIDNIEGLNLVIGDNDDIFLPVRTVASAASLSISTLNNCHNRSFIAKIRTGSWGYVNPYFRTILPLGHKIVLNMMGEYTHGDNNYPFKLKNINLITKERRNNNRMDAVHSEFNILMRPTENSQLTSKLYFYDNNRQLPGPVIYYNNVSKEKLHDRNLFIQCQFKNSFSSKLSFLSICKFNYSSSFYFDQHGRYPGGFLDNKYWQREWYASACFLYLPSNNWALDYSIDYAFNNFNSNLLESQKPYRNSLMQSITAKWQFKKISLTGRLIGSLFVNGNSNGQSAANANKLSPSLSISIKPWDKQSIFFRASYKNIFRLPTFNENYYDNYGSKDLRPENTNQINLGFTFSPKLPVQSISETFTADVYVNHVNDMIVAVPYNMFIWYMTNLDKVRTIGIDLTSNLNIDLKDQQSLLFMFNYSFQRSEPRTSPNSSEWGKQVAYIPKHSGAASLCWTNKWVDLTIHGSGVSDRFTTNNNLPQTKIKGYLETGITGRKTLAIHNNKLTLELQLLNVFNSQYEVIANYPMPGRSWKTMIKFDF